MRQYRRLKVKLSASDRKQVAEVLRGGVQAVRVVKRAQSLRSLAEGRTASEVAASVGLTAKAVREIGWRYAEGGLERALYDKPRPGAERRLTEAAEQRIIAMVCGSAPEGRARWTLRLIAEEAVKRKLVTRVGHERIRILLERHDLKPWREKNVVCGRSG